jgi:tripeptidyl-peptidase-1
MDRILHIDITLKTSSEQVSHAERILRSLSDPESNTYGQWLTAREVDELLSPPEEAVHSVVQWLIDSGIAMAGISRDFGHVIFEANVSQANSLLKTDLLEFGNDEIPWVMADTYYLPRSISDMVDFVTPAEPSSYRRSVSGQRPAAAYVTGSMVRPKSRGAALLSNGQSNSSALPVNCHDWTTPDCLRHLYGFPKLNPAEPVHPNSSFGVFLPSMATWIPADLDAFFSRFQPEIVGRRPEVLEINGGYRLTTNLSWLFNLEANLDHEYTMALTYPHPVTNIQVRPAILACFAYRRTW